MKKKIPTFRSDKLVEAFVATADLTKYDLSGGRRVLFELKAKGRIKSRLPCYRGVNLGKLA